MGNRKAQCLTKAGLKRPCRSLIQPQKRHKLRRKFQGFTWMSISQLRRWRIHTFPVPLCLDFPPLFPSFPLFSRLSSYFILPGKALAPSLPSPPHLCPTHAPVPTLSPLFGHSALTPGTGRGSGSNMDVAEEPRPEAPGMREGSSSD